MREGKWRRKEMWRWKSKAGWKEWMEGGKGRGKKRIREEES